MIDPEPYHAHIQAGENILYQNSPLELQDYGRLARAMIDLHQDILKNETNRLAVHEAHRILYLSYRTDINDAGYVLPDLGPIRTEWEEIRPDVFAPAGWFRTDTPVIASTQSLPVPRDEPQEKFALTGVIERLEALIEGGRGDVEDLGEPVYSAELVGSDGREQIERWHRWSRQGDDKLDYITGRLYKSGFYVSGLFLYAYLRSVKKAVEADLQRRYTMRLEQTTKKHSSIAIKKPVEIAGVKQ